VGVLRRRCGAESGNAAVRHCYVIIFVAFFLWLAILCKIFGYIEKKFERLKESPCNARAHS
jgi:hypothetical protein